MQTIVVAYGVEFRDLNHLTDLEAHLDEIGVKTEPGVYEYKKSKREYCVRIVFTKEEFLKALDIPDAIVIYDGHARWGQGPVLSKDKEVGHCPSSAGFRENPWEDYVRIGWDVVNVPCLEEIMNHCTNPVEYRENKAPEFCPDVVKRLYKFAAKSKPNCKKEYGRRELIMCEPEVARRENERGVQSLINRLYWRSYINDDDKENKYKDFMTLVKVGDKDLKNSELNCKVLFLNSCSSKPRFHMALQRRKHETKSKCAFYLTKRTAYPALAKTTNIFVDLVLKGIDPTSRNGSLVFMGMMNKVNAPIYKKYHKPYASGIVKFYDGIYRR